MRTTDITVLVPAKSAAPTPQQMATRGTVTIPPASITDDTVTVILPSYSADYGWPCRWIRQGNTLPAIGAECLVLWDETGAGTVVQWAGAGIALPTLADTAALDARLDALEAKRTVSGSVAADGSESSPDFSVVKNGTGDYSVTFTTAFSATPDVVPAAGPTALFFEAKLHAVTAPSTTGFRVACFLTSTNAMTDGSFTFIAHGTA